MTEKERDDINHGVYIYINWLIIDDLQLIIMAAVDVGIWKLYKYTELEYEMYT